MYEDNVHGYFGHSNDSLFASADEMAGNYTPRNDNNAFTPTRRNPAQQPASRESTGHRSTRSVDIQNMELNYPMPDEIEIWRQAEHPDSINKLLNVSGDMCQEVFKGAAQMLSHANPETFEMPLEARFICMKIEHPSDMRYCLSNGAVTNVPACNERINAVWRERDGQRVFMMFSIRGQKEFCAMAEMTGPVQNGSMPGWSKPGCVGLVILTFIYVKNVPFSLINHIKHKSNNQPVANMWNSMMYHDNTGYHVARIYCEHPVLSSVLVKFHTETQVGYKSQLRIPTSGNTTYSVSSFTSQNDKAHDPRSAIKPYIHRSGNRSSKNNASWWRPDGILPTPSRQPGPYFNPGTHATPTPVAPHAYATNQQNMAGVAQPPQLMLPNSGSSGFNDARSFTTADERMIAEFAHSRDAKRSEANQMVPNGVQHVEAATHDPFRVGPTPHNGQTRNLTAIHSDRHGTSYDARAGRPQGNYNAQWQGHGRGAVHSDDFAAGFGKAFGAIGPYNHQGQQPFSTANAMPPQLPSPVTSSHASHHGFTKPHEIRRQQSQGFALRSPPSYNTVRSRGGHGHPAPQPSDRVVQNASSNTLHSRQQQIPRSGSPIKQSQSMPQMIAQLAHRLSAQHLHAHNTDANAASEATVSASHGIHDWVQKAPTRDTFSLAKQSSSRELTAKTSTDLTTVETSTSLTTVEIPINSKKPPRGADIKGQLEYQELTVEDLDTDIEIAKTNGGPVSKRLILLLQHHKTQVGLLKIEIAAAERVHQIDSDGLAEPTVNDPPTSPSTPQDSDGLPKAADDSSIESDMIEAVHDDEGKILRSISKKREGKATHIGQKSGHRRGNVGGFTSSFDERMRATAEDILRSPTRVSAYPNHRPARTHGHPPQRTAAPPAYGQHDSCPEDQQCNEDGHYHYGYSHNDNAFDFSSQVGNDEVFSPRGRGYHAHPARDTSHMSYNGGFGYSGFGHGPEQK